MVKNDVSSTKSRNIDWTRDELILALDLYFTLNGRGEYATNPSVIDLSRILKALTPKELQLPNFRNPDGVAMKLGNIKSIDPSRGGVALPRGNKLDKIVFDGFKNDRETLKHLSNKIKSVIDSGLREIDITDVYENADAREGKLIQKLHFVKERNRYIVEKKKKSALRQSGKLDCECCGFNFLKAYGVLGADFIECHHIVPLSKLTMESKTELKDLALLCSNCHRMIHKLDNCSLETLKDLYLERQTLSNQIYKV